MSGDWIKMRGNLWDDPRIGRICDLTGVKEATAIGALYWLWAAADQHTEDGAMAGLSLQQIDRKTGVKGFAAALVDIGWLADDPQGVVIRHFEEHNGASAKKRCQTAKRVATHRTGNAVETLAPENSNAPGVTSALARDRDRDRDREEKRRETHSVPIGTGGKPPLHPDEIIFGYGVPLLVNAGSTDKAARSFLGGLRKGHGDEALIGALRNCLREKPLQPLEWLAAALPPAGAKSKPNAQEALEASNRAVADRFLAKDAAHAAH